MQFQHPHAIPSESHHSNTEPLAIQHGHCYYTRKDCYKAPKHLETWESLSLIHVHADPPCSGRQLLPTRRVDAVAGSVRLARLRPVVECQGRSEATCFGFR